MRLALPAPGRRTTAALAALAALAAPAARAQPQQGVVLPFLNAPAGAGAPITRPPTLSIGFGLRPRPAVMDTGSTGIVVSASAIPGFDNLASSGPGQVIYSSSGRVMLGRWVVVPVSIAGADGTTLRTAPIPVLGVTRMACLASARDCRPRKRPEGVAMLGVGFARERDLQAQGTPDKNPFLNPEQPGGLRRGYVVSRGAVQVGLGEAAMQGMAVVKLARAPGAPDWSPAPMCLSLRPGVPPACGNLLVDTGVSRMFMTAPPDQLGGAQGTLPHGTAVTLTLGPGAPGYGFSTGDRQAMTPAGITLVPRRDGPAFVNTGVRFLNGFDIAYDADRGEVGYRAR